MSNTATINRGGDLLSLTAQRGGTVLVTLHSVNPAAHLTGLSVPADALRTAVDDVAPSGSCTRHESPDLMDGGVTGAAIEKETEQDPRDTVEFWKGAANVAKRRAEKAEAERDSLRTEVDEMWPLRKRAEQAGQERGKALQEADRWREHAKAASERADRAAQPRPFTPDDIDNAMTDRLLDEADAMRADGIRIKIARLDAVRLLAAALTERSETAKRLDPIIDAAIRGHSEINSPTVVHAIADALAEEGVYVPEGER